MYRKSLSVGLLALLLLIVWTPAVLAQGGSGDKFVVGEDFVLAANERLNGNLAVLGGNATLETGSVVAGDVAVFGGNLVVRGTVRGNVAAFGGTVVLAEQALVQGDVAAFGGGLQRAPGAVVRGETFDMQNWRLLPGEVSGPEPPVAGRRPGSVLGQLLRWQLGTIGWGLGLVLLGLVAVVVAPRGMARIAAAVAREPALSLGMGLLTWAAGLLLGGLFLIACGLGLLIWLLLGFALLVGWLAVGLWLGERILAVLKVRDATALGQVALGVFLVTLLARLPFCIGFLFLVILGSLGLGAVVLTRFGTQAVGQAPQPPPTNADLALVPVAPAPAPVAPEPEPLLVPEPASSEPSASEAPLAPEAPTSESSAGPFAPESPAARD